MQKNELMESFTDLCLKFAEYYGQFAKTDKQKKDNIKFKRLCKRARNIIRNINHKDILDSLYNSFLQPTEVNFIYFINTLCSKQVQTWDKTVKGYKEFILLEEKGKKELADRQAEIQKEQDYIKKCKEENKKVDYIFDVKEKRLKPIIVETDNA